MIPDANAIAELEKRLRQMDALPHDLHRLKDAIDAIAALLSLQVKIEIKDSSLSGRCHDTRYVVYLKQNEYNYSYWHGPDAGNGREQSTSKMAWTIVGSGQYLRVRAIAAGLVRQKR
jgi:hypothetical protein